METFKILEPFTIYCHMKDMGVANYEDGFLLSEVVFGDGIVDLRQMVETLQKRDPNMIFALEMITERSPQDPGLQRQLLADIRRSVESATRVATWPAYSTSSARIHRRRRCQK